MKEYRKKKSDIGLPKGGLKSISMGVGIFATAALVFFILGYVYLCRAYQANGSSPAMAYIFLGINLLELTIFPWITTVNIKRTQPSYYIRYTYIWAGLLALQLVCIMVQIALPTPIFLFVPSAMLVRNVKDWWTNAGDVDIVAYDYALYNMFFVIGDFFALMMSLFGIISPLYQKKRNNRSL